jgi:hypothetical protein
MKKIKLFYFALGFITFFSYSKNKVPTLTEIRIDPSNVKPAYDISNDIEPEWEFIALETTDDCLISNIDKLIYKNGIYYLLDKQGYTLFLYDSEGKFISKLNKKGQGPEDYSQIETFTVIGKNIWISDPNLRSLICYDENLRMIDRYNTGDIMGVYDMAAIGENICIATNYSRGKKENIQCGMYDVANKEITGFLYVPTQDDKTAVFKKTNQLGVFANSCLFIHSYCDTIYRFKDNQFAPAYKVVFSERYEDIPLPIEKMMDTSLAQMIRGMECIRQTHKKIIIGYGDGKYLMTAMYDKDKGECKVYPHIVNSNIGDLKTFPYNTFFDGAYVMSTNEPETILDFYNEDNHFAKIKNESDKIKIEALRSSINPYSNPVIIRYKLKQDSNL